LLFSLLLPATTFGQLSITEFVADNDGSYLDGDGDASDWIELHNSGAVPVSTDGLFLTDSASDPTRWLLPDVTIPAGGYLVVFASGKDRRDPQGELHTNFSLSAGGEYLALVDTDGNTPVSQFTPEYPRQFYGAAYGTGTNAATESETLIPWPTAGTWIVPPSDIGDSWQSAGFDDSSWNSAQTGIGYGYSFPNFIGAGGNTDTAMRGIAGSAYVRIPFNIENPAEVVAMNLELFYEDGFAAYLNGELVASKNLPEPLGYDSIATDRGEIREAIIWKVSRWISRGSSGVAKYPRFSDSKRQHGSSDILLIPMLTAETRDLSGGVIGGYLEEPTPGAPNSGIEFTDYVRDTTFDVDRGFFEAPFGVTVESATPGATIIYTTNGSTPTLSNGTRWLLQMTPPRPRPWSTSPPAPRFVQSP
jgi:hypothetical protein